MRICFSLVLGNPDDPGQDGQSRLTREGIRACCLFRLASDEQKKTRSSVQDLDRIGSLISLKLEEFILE